MLITHSGTDDQDEMSNENTSNVSSKMVITNKIGLHNNSTRHKPYDIVSAAFEDAQLGQFEECGGNDNKF